MLPQLAAMTFTPPLLVAPVKFVADTLKFPEEPIDVACEPVSVMLRLPGATSVPVTPTVPVALTEMVRVEAGVIKLLIFAAVIERLPGFVWLREILFAASEKLPVVETVRFCRTPSEPLSPRSAVRGLLAP